MAHKCSMQKKKESLTKMQEMHPMFKNWNPRNQAQVNNTLRLAMAECPEDMPELIEIVKAKGFDVPSGLTPATGWGSFESKSKMQEMHPLFKNWNPRNQSQVNNTLRLAMAECPEDMPELIKIVKEKGFDVPSGLTPATGWGSFESKSKRQCKTCSMQKKKESLNKTFEVADTGELTFSFDGVNVMVTTVGDGEYVQEYTMDVRGSFDNLTDVITLVADKAIYDSDFEKPENWNVLDVDQGSVMLSAATTQNGDGDNDPDGKYIADFTIIVDCLITEQASKSEIQNALSAAKISH